MRLAILVAAIAALTCSQALAAPGPRVGFFVAADGSDRNPGTRAKPFLTLERAREAIRKVKQAGQLPGPVTVWIRGGTYHRRATFSLTAQDSGTKDCPIAYRAYRREQVVLTGGREVTGFKPVKDPAVLTLLEAGTRGKVLCADLKAQGITNFGELKPRGFGRPEYAAGLELFFQGKPMTLARWPNEGWAKIAGVPESGGKFNYEGDRPNRWANADDVWVHGYWTWDWAESYEKVESIDTQAKVIATREPHGVYGYSAGKRYYALNLLEELDAPGEWYLDRKTGVLYFWPPEAVAEGDVVVSLLEQPLVSMADTSYVTLRGLTFECVRGTAIEVKGGAHSLIAECTVRNVGTTGIIIGGGTHNGVSGCHVYQLGDGAVSLSGGDRMTLTAGSNYVIKSEIHDFSRWVRTYRPAVAINGVGDRIANNLIYDAPHSAIILGGNEHLIEFNEIHHVCMETSDAGAFYMGRDVTQRGNVVRYNYFHHLGHRDVQSVYLDDCTAGTFVYGNVCYKGARGVLLGGGRDNIIENNVFVECNPAVHVDARGMGWASFWFDGRDNTLMDRLKAVNYTQPPYSVRYPQLLTWLEDEPAVPKGNKIERNICVGGRWLDLYDGLAEEIVTVRDNWTEGDPGFVAPDEENWQLREDAPAYRIGFKPIPMEKIGVPRHLVVAP